MFSCIPENAINLIFLNTHQMQAQLHKLLSLLKNPNMELEKKKKNPRVQTTTFNTYLNLQRGMPRLQTTINFMPPLSLQATN